MIGALGAALAAPAMARAQPASSRIVGYLSPRSPESEAEQLAGYRQGLRATGYEDGVNLRFEGRWAEGSYERLLPLAAGLARLEPAVIVTNGGPQPARAAHAAAPATPIVFTSGSDPVRDGLVENLNRPEGNLTGFHVFTTSLGPKRLDLLRELVPSARSVGFLVNPLSDIAEMQIAEVSAAAAGAGIRLELARAGTAATLDETFADLAVRRVDAVLMSADLFFQVERDHVVALAARYAIPTMYEWPDFVAAGGLASYSTDRREIWFRCGVYVGRILGGTRIADLPVVQSTRFTFAINLGTARRLGLAVSPMLLARADEVVE